MLRPADIRLPDAVTLRCWHCDQISIVERETYLKAYSCPKCGEEIGASADKGPDDYRGAINTQEIVPGPGYKRGPGPNCYGSMFH